MRKSGKKHSPPTRVREFKEKEETMAPKCSKCGVSVMEEILHRNNPKGELADWRCKYCLDDPNIDDDLLEFCELLKECGMRIGKEAADEG